MLRSKRDLLRNNRDLLRPKAPPSMAATDAQQSFYIVSLDLGKKKRGGK